MPNTLAHIALLVWPIVTIVLFQRLSAAKAAAVSIVAGYLLLPTEAKFDLPFVPPWDKYLAAALPAAIMVALKTRPQPARLRTAAPAADAHVMPGWLPRETILRICVIVIVAGPFLTSLTNGDTLHFAWKTLPALGIREAASSVMGALIMVLPFLIARKFFAHPREHAALLGVFCVAGLAYSLPALYEIRMSPQLNNMIYGFFPHSWVQHLRGGGFRPLVFLEHGLRLAIFIACAFLATLGWMRSQGVGRRPQLILAALWLLGTLVLCKSLTALVIAALFAPVILIFGVRLQLIVAGLFALTVLLYPMMRGVGLVPTGQIVSALSYVASADRIRSLEFRFRNEDALIERANRRALFGWGRFGRNVVYSEETGREEAFPEGSWIISFGQYGWIGYLSQFGLLTIPVMLLAFRRRNDLTIASSALTVVLVANLLDLMPNSGLTPITWLMAGAIAGRLELGRVEDWAPAEEASRGIGQASPYRRALSAPAAAGGAAPPPSAAKPHYRRTEIARSYRGTPRKAD